MTTNLTMTSAVYDTANSKFGTAALSGGYAQGPSGSIIVTSYALFTVDTWVNTTSTALGVAGQLSPNLWWGVNASGYAILGDPSTNGSTATTKIINDGAWHHIRVVSDSTSLRFYVDGTLYITKAALTSSGITGAQFSLRKFTGGSGYDWTGEVDETALFNSALTTGSSYTVPSAAYTGSESNLAALYQLDSNGNDSAAGTPTTTIARTNAAFFYAPYAWHDDGTSANANSVGAYFKFTFTGTSLTLNFLAQSSGITGGYPILRAYIDTLPIIETTLASGQTTWNIASGLSSGTHTVKIMIRAMGEGGGSWTLANGLGVTGVTVDSGATVGAPATLAKRAIGFGDSIFNGGGILSSASSYTGEDPSSSYAQLIMQALGAEYGAIGYSGQGFNKAASDSSVPAFNTAYASYSSGVSRLVGGVFSPSPDYVICQHGTNPILSGGSYAQSDVATAISNLRAAAPNAWIFFIIPLGGFGRSLITAAVNAAISAGDTKLVLVDIGTDFQAGLQAIGAPSQFASDGAHPYGWVHATAVAKMMPQVQHALEPRRFTVNAA